MHITHSLLAFLAYSDCSQNLLQRQAAAAASSARLALDGALLVRGPPREGGVRIGAMDRLLRLRFGEDLVLPVVLIITERRGCALLALVQQRPQLLLVRALSGAG